MRSIVVVGVVVLTAGFQQVGASKCGIADVESSPDGHVKYIPSRCESLHIHGDTENLESYIAAIEMHPTLTSLSFAQDAIHYKKPDHSSISFDDIVDLFEILPNTNIVSLNLAFNKLGDKGLEYIATKLTNNKLLLELDLQRTDISDKGLRTLAKVLLKDDSSLTSINLGYNNIGGAAEELLEAVKTHSKISQLGLSGTALGRAQHELGTHISNVVSGQCAHSAWGEWSKCEGNCGDKATTVRSRTLLHRPHPRHSNECSESTTQSRKCTVHCDEEESKDYNPKETKSTWSSMFGASEEKPKATEMKRMRPEKTQAEPAVDQPDPVMEPDTQAKPESIATEPIAEDSSESKSYKTRLENFYRKYNPSKMETVDMMLGRFQGREEVLFNSLVTKYGPEPEY